MLVSSSPSASPLRRRGDTVRRGRPVTALAHLIRHTTVSTPTIGLIDAVIANVDCDSVECAWLCPVCATRGGSGSGDSGCGATFILRWHEAEYLGRGGAAQQERLPWETTTARCRGDLADDVPTSDDATDKFRSQPVVRVTVSELRPCTTYHVVVADASTVGLESLRMEVTTSAAIPPALELPTIADVSWCSIEVQLSPEELTNTPTSRSLRPPSRARSPASARRAGSASQRSRPPTPSSPEAPLVVEGLATALGSPATSPRLVASPTGSPRRLPSSSPQGRSALSRGGTDSPWQTGLLPPPAGLRDRVQVVVAAELRTILLTPQPTADDVRVSKTAAPNEEGRFTAWWRPDATRSPSRCGPRSFATCVTGLPEATDLLCCARRVSSDGAVGNWTQPLPFRTQSMPPPPPHLIAAIRPPEPFQEGGDGSDGTTTHDTLSLALRLSYPAPLVVDDMRVRARVFDVAGTEAVCDLELRAAVLRGQLRRFYEGGAGGAAGAHRDLDAITQRYRGAEGGLFVELGKRYAAHASTARRYAAFWIGDDGSRPSRDRSIEALALLLVSDAPSGQAVAEGDELVRLVADATSLVDPTPPRGKLRVEQSISIPGLPASTRLLALVTCVNRDGVEGAPTSIFGRLPGAAVGALTASSVGSRSCELHFAPPSAPRAADPSLPMRFHYQPWRRVTADAVWVPLLGSHVVEREGTADVSVSVGGFEPNTSYDVAVTCLPVSSSATGSVAWSSHTAPAAHIPTVAVRTAPSAPTGLTVLPTPATPVVGDGDVDVKFSFVDGGFLPLAVEATVAVGCVRAAAPERVAYYGQPRSRNGVRPRAVVAASDGGMEERCETAGPSGAATFAMRVSMPECSVAATGGGIPSSVATLVVARRDVKNCILGTASLAAAARHARREIDSRDTLSPVDQWLRSPKKKQSPRVAASLVPPLRWDGLLADLRIRLRLVCADGQGSSVFVDAARVVALDSE